MKEPRLLMVGCGILEKEITWLIEKNAWPLDTLFLDSALHIDLGDQVVARALGKKSDIIRAIFREDRKYLLGLRTPCSGDFTVAAEKAAELAGLPLRWMDVPLDNLEAILQSMLDRKIGATYARDAFAAR